MSRFLSPHRFPTTHWRRIARAGDPADPEARAAMADLCGAYWYLIYALIRRKGHGADEALDLTQDYFARLLEKGMVAAADPIKGRFLREPSHDQTPERMFERDWALALIARAFDAIERHYAGTGRAELFRRLKPLVSSDPDAASRAAIAAELGLTDGSLRVALHRVRARFATALRAEVAATLRDAGEAAVEDELRALFAVLGA